MSDRTLGQIGEQSSRSPHRYSDQAATSALERTLKDTPQPRVRVQCDKEVNACAIMDAFMITADGAGAVKVWLASTGELERTIECKAAVLSLAVKGHGADMRIATGDAGGHAKFWHPDGQLLQIMTCAGEVIWACVCSSGEAISRVASLAHRCAASP
jgi:hypothetical protein